MGVKSRRLSGLSWVAEIMVFDIIAAVVGAFFGFLGWRRGLIRTLFQLVGLIAALVIASQFYPFGARLVNKLLTFSGAMLAVFGFVLVFVAVYLFFLLLAAMLKTLLRKMHLAWLDHGLGLLFGLCEGVLLLCVLVWSLETFPELHLTPHLEAKTVTYRPIHKIEVKTIRFLALEKPLGELRYAIRHLLLLPETPSAPQNSSRSSKP